MANEPRHIRQQATDKQDVKAMQRTEKDRRAATEERAKEQFGEVKASPDVYPETSGDTRLEQRNEADYASPSGEGYLQTASTADDHKEKVGKDGLSKQAKESVKQ